MWIRCGCCGGCVLRLDMITCRDKTCKFYSKENKSDREKANNSRKTQKTIK